MKRLVLLSLLFAPVAFAQVDDSAGKRTATLAYTCSAGTCTISPPTTSVTDGMPLIDIKSFRVVVCADSTRTLSGAGTLDFYYYTPTGALWTVNPTLQLPIGTSAVRCRTFPDQRVAIGRGRVTVIPTGITVSAGDLTIYIEASTR